MNTFKNWRKIMDFGNQQKAAEALGYSTQRVKQWEGDPETHKLPYAVRLAMAALFHKVEPWNDSKDN